MDSLDLLVNRVSKEHRVQQVRRVILVSLELKDCWVLLDRLEIQDLVDRQALLASLVRVEQRDSVVKTDCLDLLERLESRVLLG